jgi:hypothetical protein
LRLTADDDAAVATYAFYSLWRIDGLRSDLAMNRVRDCLAGYFGRGSKRAALRVLGTVPEAALNYLDDIVSIASAARGQDWRDFSEVGRAASEALHVIASLGPDARGASERLRALFYEVLAPEVGAALAAIDTASYMSMIQGLLHSTDVTRVEAALRTMRWGEDVPEQLRLSVLSLGGSRDPGVRALAACTIVSLELDIDLRLAAMLQLLDDAVEAVAAEAVECLGRSSVRARELASQLIGTTATDLTWNQRRRLSALRARMAR